MLGAVIFVLVVALTSWLVMSRVRARLLRILALVPLLSLAALLGVTVLQFPGAEAGGAAQAVQIIDESVVEIGDLTVIVSGTGTVAPLRQVALAFEGTGPVSEILATEGQYVEAGDVLAKLDAADLEAAVQEAQIALDLQQAAFDALTSPPREVDIAAAEAALKAAQANFGAATLTGPDENAKEIARLQAELARNQLWQTQLQRDGATQAVTLNPITAEDIPDRIEVPQSVLDDVNDIIDEINLRTVSSQPITQLESAVKQADYGVQIADANYSDVLNSGPDLGALASANAARIQAEIALNRLLNGPSDTELRLAEIDLQRAQLALEQAQDNLSRMALIAPFSGVIAQNNLIVGELPPADAPAILLIDAGGYQLDLAIDETDVVNVQVGQNAAITLDALPGVELTGKVTRIAVTPTRVGQLVTYSVRVLLDPTSAPVRVGMSATARIAVSELHDVPVLRNRFIRIDRTTQQAFVTVQREDGRYEETAVTLGLRNETHSQILGGLEVGQRVVLLPRGTYNPIGS